MKIVIYCCLMLTLNSHALANPWLSLIPESERQQAHTPINHEKKLEQQAQQSRQGSMVQALDGQHMRIPGFVVPLESSDSKITEFLLVPFFGACLHVPPPPPNQIIYIKHDKGIDMIEPWQVIWIEGELAVTNTRVDGVADAGYAMLLSKEIELYKQ